jgi:hypothetical protein
MQHPDEGMIHAWLDGELSEDQANEISTHLGECPACAASVAEARGLIAASTRILTALDDVPRGVTSREPAVLESTAPALLPSRDRRWYDRTDVRAAAAVLFVAGASLVLVRTRAPQPAGEMMTMAAERAKAAPKAIVDSNSPSAMSSAVEDRSLIDRAASPPATKSRDERQLMAPPAWSLRKPQALAPNEGRAMHDEADVPSKVQLNAAITTDRLSMGVPAPATAEAAAKALLPSANSGLIARKEAISGITRSDVQAPSVVEGRVVDRGTGEGLRSAEILVVGTPLTAFTDSTGKFEIADVPAGNQQLAIRRIGYAQQYVALNVGQGANVTANIALERMSSVLSEVVTGAAVTSRLAMVPLRIVRVDTIADTRRTTYELSGGIRITLTDSTLDARLNKDLGAAQIAPRSVASAPRPTDSPKEKSADTDKAEIPDQSSAREGKKMAVGGAAAMTVQAKVNVLAWTDHGHRYVLSGPLTGTELEALKTRIMQMRR